MDSGWDKNECLCNVEASKKKRPRVYGEKLPGLVIKEVTLPADSALSSLYMGKMLTLALLPESTVLAHALIVSPSLA